MAGGRVEDGENFDDLKSRALAALDFLERRPEENILVVTHGFFLRVLAASVLFGGNLTGEFLRAFALGMLTKNTGLFVFENNPEVARSSGQFYTTASRWRIMVWNDHAHLAEP
jgi:broad specificity phosphatase PhoE